MLDKVIYAKEEKDFVVHSEELPPVIAPILRGPVVYNTEHENKGVYLKKTSSLRVHTFTVWKSLSSFKTIEHLAHGPRP